MDLQSRAQWEEYTKAKDDMFQASDTFGGRWSEEALSESPWVHCVADVCQQASYVAFHTTVLERLLAVFRDKSNIGYLMYLADAAGYLGYVAVMLLRNFGQVGDGFLTFFIQLSGALGLLALGLLVISLIYFRRHMSRLPELAVT